MSLFLQSNELNEDLWWIIGALIVLGVVFFLTKRAQYTQRAKRLGDNDPRKDVVNDTNYNINHEGIDGHRAKNMTKAEASEVIENMRETDYIPSEDEFDDLRKDLEK